MTMTDQESSQRRLCADNEAPPAERTAPSRWLPVIVLIAGLLPYLNSFSGAFVFDDGQHIVENEQIRRFWPPWEFVTTSRRPVVALSLAINYRFGELRVWGYHAFNLAVHILAALTLFGIVRRTMQRGSIRCRRKASPTSSSAANH